MTTAVRKNSQVEQTARDIAEFVAGKYVLTATARVLMWREVVGEFYESRQWKPPEWVRDSQDVHQHWKRYGRMVKRILESQFGVTVICISNKARSYLKHSDLPSRDEWRTDSFYRQCIPSSSSATFGIVCFPREGFTDHPLVTFQLERRGTASANGLTNALQAIDTAENHGAITCEMRSHIVGNVLPSVAIAIANVSKPQEPPAIGGPVAPSV